MATTAARTTVASSTTVARSRDVARARVARGGDLAYRRRDDGCRRRRVGARARVVASGGARDGQEGERRYVRQGHANEDVERERVRARVREREREIRGATTRRRATKTLTTRYDSTGRDAGKLLRVRCLSANEG